MRDLVKAFKALSDETRLRILNILLERECCVCEVMQALELRKDGLWSIYSIDRKEMKRYLPDLMEAMTKGLEGNKLARQDLERLKKAERVGPGCAERIRENTPTT